MPRCTRCTALSQLINVNDFNMNCTAMHCTALASSYFYGLRFSLMVLVFFETTTTRTIDMYKIELLLSKITSNYVCVEKHRIKLIVSVLCKPKSGFFIKQLELLGPVGQRKGGRDILRACLAAWLAE